MVNHEIQQGMIPLSAPTISANAAKPNGVAPSASPKGAEIADFAALLGLAGSAGEAPEAIVPDMAGVLTAALAALPDGKAGKVAGKTLPLAELAAPRNADFDPTAIGDLETSEAPDEAISDQADVPIAAAIPVLPLLVPPLPGAGVPAEFRAAGPNGAPARPAVAEPTRAATAAPAALQAVQQQIVAPTVVPAQVLGIELAPVVTVEALSQVEAQSAIGTQISSMNPALHQKSGNLNQPPLVPAPEGIEGVMDADAASSSTSLASSMRSGLRTSGSGVEFMRNVPGQRSGSTPAEAFSPQAQVPGVEPATAKPAAAPTALTATKREDAQPNPAPVAKDRLATRGAELDRATEITQPVMHQVHANSQPAAPVRITEAAPAVGAAQPAAEQPHDFDTLVGRLSEAREAASPKVVRTALQHAEFGKISLQFRHDDANLSVTMANADPAFTSAVHGAVAATLAGNAAGNGDQPQSDRQQPQQAQTASQQQSATSGNGGQGQQNAAQARAEQSERNFHRAQGSSARAQQSETASSDRAGTATRRSGIYA